MANKKNQKGKKRHPSAQQKPQKQATKPSNATLYGLDVKKLILSMLAIVFVVFIPTLSAEFIHWDDPEYTYNNPLLKDFSLGKVFSTETFHMGNYHPLTITWFYLESKVFGFDTFYFHLNNLVIHLFNTFLVFVFIRELLDRKDLFVPAATALLFGIHPMHVESVAWVSELKDVLYAMFFLAGCYFYVKYVRAKDVKSLVIVFLCFLGSLFSKGQAVVFPVILLLIDLYLKRKDYARFIGEKLPFLALSVYFGLLAIDAQRATEAINADYQGLDVLFYGSYGLVFYIKQLFLPLGLSGAHPYPFNPVFQDMPGSFKLMPIVILALAVLLGLAARKRAYIWFGVGFFLISIFIVLKLIPVGDTIVAERYTYIPYIGLFFALAVWIRDVIKNKQYQWVKYIGAGAMVVFAFTAFSRVGVWNNTISFWEDVQLKYPSYWRGYNNVGEHFVKEGNYEKAAEYFQQAIDKDEYAPPIPFIQLGTIQMNNLNDAEGAIKTFQRAADFPNKGDMLYRSARINLAQAHIKAKSPDEAVKALQGLERFFPNDGLIMNVRGRAYAAKGSTDSALLYFNKAIELNNTDHTFYMQRGILFTDVLNQYENGIRDFRRVLELNPGYHDASLNIGVASYKSGDYQEAIKRYSEFIKVKPNNARTYMLRALAYGAAEDYDNALKDAGIAQSGGVRMDPNLLQSWQSKR